MKFRLNTLVGGILFIVAAATGCLKQGRLESFGPGKGGSILADIGGLEAEDRALAGIRYVLKCERAGQPLEKVPADKQTNDFVSFPAATLKDGDACAMEIWADVDRKFNYTWYGVDGAGAPVVGLYYSSDKKQIASSKLALTLYKLYSKTPTDFFSATVQVAFKLKEGTTMPADDKTIANLQCGDANYPSAKAEAVTGAADARTFKFTDLSVAKMKPAACTKLTVLVENQPAYVTSEVLAIKFENVQVGTEVKFGPFNVETAPSDSVIVETVRGIECTSFDTTTRQCLSISLPRYKNYWFAVVAGEKAGAPVTYVVSAAQGLRLDQGDRVKSIAAMNAQIAGGAASYTFYAVDAKATILGAELGAPVQGSLQPLGATDLTGVQLRRFAEFYLHGFQEVGESTLRTRTASASLARWFALVTATEGTRSGKFIVAGGQKYMQSAKLADGNLFSWQAFRAERDQSSSRYRTYAVNNESLVTHDCSASIDYYLDDLSAESAEGLSSAAQHPVADACEISSFPAEFDNWQIRAQMFLWGWHAQQL